MEELLQVRETLLKRVINFKKSINHQFSKSFLETVKLETSELLDRVRSTHKESDLVQQCERRDILSECEWLGVQIIKFISDHNGSSELAAMAISFRDVEQALTRFNGEGAKVETWLEDFEATATVYDWKDLQRYVYCRQLLEGGAKIAVNTKRAINSYATLKAFLLVEFAAEINSADLHDQLRKMKKDRSESSVVFGYRVLAVAAMGDVDTQATLSYIVRGMGPSCANKAIMLSMTTWKDLRKLLVAHDQASEMDTSARGSGYRPNPVGGATPFIKAEHIKQERGEKPKCFKCGIVGHISRDCRKNNGNCFKCGQPGHIAARCSSGSGAPVAPSTSV